MLEDQLAKADRFVSAKEWRLLSARLRAKLQYKSLSRSDVEPIRLLLLYPRSAGSDAIHGKFVRASLSNPPVYSALSYTWGNPFANPYAALAEDPELKIDATCKVFAQHQSWLASATRHQIYVDGRVVEIGQNLYDALHSMRDEKRKLLVWVDALCINQGDDDEKRHQVSIMNLIYSKAKRVFVWLGPDPVFAQLLRTNSNLYDGEVSTDPSSFSRTMLFGRIFTSAWFQRLWIVQEVAVAGNMVFRCGNIEMEFWELQALKDSKKMVDYRAAGYSTEADDALIERAMHNFTRIAAARLLSTPIRLDIAIFCWRRNLCRDPRDRVYAVLSLAVKSDRSLLLRPDYGVSIAELSTQVVVKSIETYGTLDVLRYVHHVTRSAPKSPSWSFPLEMGVEMDDGRIHHPETSEHNNVITAFEIAERQRNRPLPRHVVIGTREALVLSGRVVAEVGYTGKTIYLRQNTISQELDQIDADHFQPRVRTPISAEDASYFDALLSSPSADAPCGNESEDFLADQFTTSHHAKDDTQDLASPILVSGLAQSTEPGVTVESPGHTTRANDMQLFTPALPAPLPSRRQYLAYMYSRRWLKWDWFIPELDSFDIAVFERYNNARYPGEMYKNRKLALLSTTTTRHPAKHGPHHGDREYQRDGYYALVPRDTRPGDCIVMLSHSRNPFILRRLETEEAVAVANGNAKGASATPTKTANGKRTGTKHPGEHAAAASEPEAEAAAKPEKAFTLIGACFLERRLDWDAFEALRMEDLDEFTLY